jgi:hypothetical protein
LQEASGGEIFCGKLKAGGKYSRRLSADDSLKSFSTVNMDYSGLKLSFRDNGTVENRGAGTTVFASGQK